MSLCRFRLPRLPMMMILLAAAAADYDMLDRHDTPDLLAIAIIATPPATLRQMLMIFSLLTPLYYDALRC